MRKLLTLEAKKWKLGKYGILSVLAIISTLLFITVSLLDSASDPRQSKDSFATMFQMIEILLSFIYIVFFAVMVSNILIKEYNTGSIMIMFSYPIDRKKLITAKLTLITICIVLSLLAGYGICCGYIVLVDHFFDLLAGSFEVSYLFNWMIRMCISIPICICIGLLSFSAGMLHTSVPMTIVSSILFIFLRQIALSSSYGYTENLLQSLVIAAITILCVSLSYRYRIHDIAR